MIGGLFAAWRLGVHSFGEILLLATVLGVAGASFAIALPMASSLVSPRNTRAWP